MKIRKGDVIRHGFRLFVVVVLRRGVKYGFASQVDGLDGPRIESAATRHLNLWPIENHDQWDVIDNIGGDQW